MRLPSWPKRRRRQPAARKIRASRSRRNLFETLEDRRMLAVITVTEVTADVVDNGQVSLAEAILAANTDASVDGSVAGSGADTIEFGGLTGTITLTSELTISSELEIVGSGSQSLTITGGDATRLFNITNAANGDVILRGMTLTNGSAIAGTDGGAILIDSPATTTLDDVIIQNSNSTRDGGGIAQLQGALRMTSVVLAGNTAADDGGGLYTENADSFSFNGVAFDDNEAALRGGAIASIGTTGNISNSLINNNRTTANDGYGGGIFTMDESLTIFTSLISNNTTAGSFADGAAIFSDTDLGSQTTRIISSTLSGNSSAGRGGGIFNLDGETSIELSTITDNQATTENATMRGGGGVASEGGTNTRTRVYTSIISANQDNNGDNDVEIVDGITNTFISANFNLIGSGSGIGAFNMSGDIPDVVNPILGPLADNGGNLMTHEILANSPALNAGDPNFDPNTFPFDQRGTGFVRVSDGRVDIGAFELQVTNNNPPTITEILDQFIPVDSNTGALAFTIGDNATPVDALVVTASSSNQILVPDANVVLGGSGPDRTVTVTPATGQVGMATITIVVTDADMEMTTETFELSVGNTLPTITAIADQSVEVNTPTAALPFTISDAETALDTLVVTATAADQALVPDANIVLGGTGADRTITVTPAMNIIGSTDITVTVTDEGGLSATSTFVLSVATVNAPPTITDIIDQSIPESTTSPAIPFTVTDDATPVDMLTVTGTSSDPTLVPDSNIVVTGNGNDRTVNITPITGQTGETTITLTVTDENGATASDSFVLTVFGLNTPPSISEIPDQAIATNSSTLISFTIDDFQTFAGSLVVSATSSNETLIPNANLVLGGSLTNRTLSLSPATDEIGTTTISVTVTDEDNLTTTETFVLSVNAQSVGGQVFFDADGDGQQGPLEVGVFGVVVYLDANDNEALDSNETFTQTNSLGQYFFTGLLPGDHLIRIQPPGGQVQSSPTAYLGTGNVIVGNSLTQLYEMSLDGNVRPFGSPTGARIHDLVRTNDGTIIGIGAFTDSIYSIDRITGQESLLSASTLDLAFGLAYDPGTDTIYTLAVETGTADRMRLHTVNPNTGELSAPLGDGLDGLVSVSDLAFDTVNNRIVGFDNSDDQFFQFLPDGTGQSLSVASRPLESFSLAFNGTTFVMFDQEEVTNTQTLEVNPDTGEIFNGFLASQRIPTEGLFHAKRGDVPRQITLTGSEIITDLDFGLAVDNTTPQVDDFPTLINEILVDPAIGREDSDQYIEIRGTPGGQLNPNTYFVIVDEDGGNPGTIHGIFDLSDQPLGENGFLVLLEQGHIYQPDPNSAVLESNAEGFSGLPGGIYSDSHGLSERIDFILGANGYFLIETDVPPLLGDDIDADDNGLADPGGVKSNWNVLDSISLHPNLLNAGMAYGQILLAETDSFQDPNSRIVEPGTPIVVTNGFGYAGRIGDSVGSSPDDWTFGSVATAVQSALGQPSLYELDSGSTRDTAPRAFQLRDLDHVGDSNFVGGVRGTVEIAPGLGETDPFGNPLTTQPGEGLTVFADVNNNGAQDLISHIVDPDFGVDFANAFDGNGNEIRFPLSNIFPGVTVTAVDNTNEPIRAEVETALETNFFLTPTNNYLFSYQGIDTFSDLRRLRFDFYRPVTEASIEAIGFQFGIVPTFGRLDAYDANDQLIDSTLSGLLVGQARETITVTSDTENIAYVVAYADDMIPNTAAGRFDRLTFRQTEASAVTDDTGQYEIKHLFPGTYDVSVLRNEQSEGLIGGSPRRIVVNRYENFIFNDTLRPNVAPDVPQDIEFRIDENTTVGTTIGFIQANDLDRQQIQYQLLSGAESGLLLDPDTGELTVGPDAELDFEDITEIELEVGVTDAFETTMTTVTVFLDDLNEAPVVEEAVFFVAEDTPNGSTIGQVEAFDPDFSQGQTLTYEVLGGSGVGIFALNPANGLITLIDDSAINFETLDELDLQIRISDSAIPALFTDIDQRIRVVDQNDPPVVSTTAFSIFENSTGVVAQLQAADPDLQQTHVFELLGGTGEDLFLVQRNGDIEVREGMVIDFEQGETYTLQVIAIDSGAPPLAAEGTVTLTIQDVNEPPALDQTSVQVAENSPGGTSVTTLSVIDPENSGSAYTIELLDSFDGAKFVLDPSTNELTVAEGADLDFEAKAVNEVRFAITDPTESDPVTEVALLVELTDENDPPLVVTREVIISELAAPGTVVGRVEVQIREPDSGDVVTSEIVGGNAANLIEIDSATRILRIAPGATFDADGDPDPLSIDVRVTDEGGLSSVGTIAVILNDVDEPPVFVGGSLSPPPIGSGEPLELIIPADAIVDPEGGDFSIAVFGEGGQLPDWLEFNEATRTLSGLATPELVGIYPLTIRAFEPGPLELFQDASIEVVVQIGSTPLTNQRNPLDVDANGEVAPIDALRVINFMGRHGSGASVTEQNPFTGFVDVTGDGTVTARDALLVINGLQQEPQAFGELVSAEGEDQDQTNDDALLQLLAESSLF